MKDDVLKVSTAQRLERSEMEYMIDRMRAIEERSGNPMGIETQYFGEAVAFYSREMPWPQFNTVKGIGSAEESYLSEIISFYRSRNRNPHIEVTPLRAEPTLFRSLARQGFFQSSFHATLYTGCKKKSASPLEKWTNDKENAEIIEINSNQFDDYAMVHCLGTGLPISGKQHIADNNRILHGRKGWKYYVAYYNNEPVGAAAAYIQGSTASLTFATTLPAYRNRGIQTLLIERRMRDAVQEGCNLIVGQAAYLSSSFRNMQRAGMQLGYTRSTWSSLMPLSGLM
ncbi:GNAT family N-acetyltransferase [Paenibacillus gallinarum]|uniref:GNAT family N-acetyltransferase n=1 Tax=Paenibacillus gallinarum TaxID=2762232 RepID=A0ABR8STK3_9BACL|nr:GNAT family N-acetyltransferase [Paenibacillus gallinarum]MBD7966811.1 GNAT family N-acetyltransferase [Paenibacillus gallinarum]